MADGAAATAPTTTTAAPIATTSNNQRPLYRFRPPPPPQKIHHHHHRRRNRCCILFRCCFFSILILLLLLLLIATSGAAFYILYRPHRPTVAVNSLRFTKFNLTTTNASITSLTSTLSFIVTVTNPNDKIEFLYDQIWLQATLSDGGIDAGDGSIDGFVHGSKNVTDLSGEISKVNETVTEGSVMTRKKRMTVEIEMRTRVRVRIGRVMTKRIKVMASCRGTAAVGKAEAVVGGVGCKVMPVVKIVNWNIL